MQAACARAVYAFVCMVIGSLLFCITLLLRITYKRWEGGREREREREGERRRTFPDNPISHYFSGKRTCSCFIWCSCSRRSDTLRFIPCRLTCIDEAPAGWWMTAGSTVATVFFPPDKLAAPASKQQHRLSSPAEKVQTWSFLCTPNSHALHTDGHENKTTVASAQGSGISPSDVIGETVQYQSVSVLEPQPYQSTALPQDCFLPHVVEIGKLAITARYTKQQQIKSVLKVALGSPSQEPSGSKLIQIHRTPELHMCWLIQSNCQVWGKGFYRESYFAA